MSSSFPDHLIAATLDAIPPAKIRHVLVIKLRHHGDVLLASPVISALQAALPQAGIDALVYAETAPMLTGHPSLSTLFTMDRAWKKRGAIFKMQAEWRLFCALRTQKYDLIVHLTENWRGAWLARFLGAPFSVAPKVAGRTRFWRKSFTHLYATPGKANRHTVERNLDALRRIGLFPPRNESWPLILVPGTEAETKIERWLADSGLQSSRFIHFHPASRWHFKCWPSTSCAALIERLQQNGWPVVLTAAPDTTELAQVEAIQTQLGQKALDLSGQLSLRELAALTARARLFIGVDSAPMHMAAAVETPAVALFGPSGELEWGPWGGRDIHRVVCSQTHTCRPCGLDGCGGSKISDCLVKLSVDQVYQAVAGVLAQEPPKKL